MTSPVARQARDAIGRVLLAGLIAGPVTIGASSGWADAASPGEASRADAVSWLQGQGFATLEDCYRIAAAGNERIGIAREALVQSELDRKIAMSRVLPRVSAEGRYYQQNSVNVSGGACGSDSGFSFCDNRAEAYLNLTQPIFSGLRERNYIGYTREAIASSRLSAKDAERQLYGAVATAFYEVLQAEANVATLRDTVELGRKRLDEMKARREVGLARKTEVLLVDSQLAEDSSRLTRAANNALLARDRLDLLVGGPVRVALHDTLELPPEVLATTGSEAESREGEAATEGAAVSQGADIEDELVLSALAARDDLLAGEREVEAARRLVGVARGEYAPVVDLEANYILGRKNFSTYVQETDWEARLNFTLPLFEGGRIRANVAAAESRLRQAELRHNELVRQVRLDVRGAWLTVRSDAAQLPTLEARLGASDENYRLAEGEYRNGLSTSLEVFTAQNQLLSARLALDRQRHQVKLDWLALRVAQGLLPAADNTMDTSKRGHAE